MVKKRSREKSKFPRKGVIGFATPEDRERFYKFHPGLKERVLAELEAERRAKVEEQLKNGSAPGGQTDKR